jgi:hypothetical protein
MNDCHFKGVSMKTVSRVCLLLMVALLMLSASAYAALLKGKTTVSAGAVSDVKVMAYSADLLTFNAPSPHVSAATADDGLFTLELPEGRYYLFANGMHLSAYYGRNPITVPKEGLENVNLLLTPDNLPGPSEITTLESGIVGRVSLDGKPVSNAIVTVYPDLSSQLKGLGLGMAAPTDQQGYFELPLLSGTYYVVVRVRKSGQMAGPLKAGDLFGYLSGNPLVLAEGIPARIHIPLIEVPEKVDRHAASMFGNTLVTGQILDQKGRPVAGVQVLLYDDSMMLNRPLFVSQKTGPDGRYQLSFPKGGHYYLAARNELGGTPAPGESYGRYQGSPDHSIDIETGKVLEGIEIVVDEVY